MSSDPDTLPGARRKPLPSGTVTFAFTDIEGSTQRWDRDRAAMEGAVRRHDALLRAALGAHGGYVFKTMGDAFCAAFARPEDAVAAALAAQRALAAEDFSAVDGLRVRIAIHTGTADERDGDYFGPALNRVARLLPLGHGGQVLLTAIAAELVRDNLPPHVSLASLGPHALKDLKGDEHVHQLVAPGLQGDFPPLRAPKAEGPWLVPDAMRTRYFTGREDVLAQLRAQLAARGRAALCGLGGAGKTQAVMEYAARYRAEYPGGVFWVNAETLGGLTSGFGDIAATLRLPEAASGDQSQTVRAVLDWFGRADRWLLILDNVDDRRGVKPFVPERAGGHVLITSREAAFGELGIPRALELRDLREEEAVRFLLARTGREDCDARDRTAARELASELGNLPLALEQAAAYMAETSVTFAGYLAAFRKRRVALLENASGLVARDTVAVTWAANFAAVEQTSPASAEVLRLSAFLAPDAIPFELFEEEEADPDETVVADLLRPLARYSLVRTDMPARSYGIHRLVQDVVRAALGDETCRGYVARAVGALDAVAHGSEYSSWARYERVVAHVLALASWIVFYGVAPEGAPGVLNKSARYLVQRGRYAEAEPLAQQALALGRQMLGPDDPEVAISLGSLATLTLRQGRHAESEALQEQALAIREKAFGPEHPQVGNALINFANIYLVQGRYAEAEPRYERAIALFRKASGEDSEGVATSYNNLARIYAETGRYEEALRLDERALAIRRRVFGEEHPHVALSFNMVGEGYARQGKYAEAKALIEDALAMRERTLGPEHDEVVENLCSLGMLHVRFGRYGEARPPCERALSIVERALGPEHALAASATLGLAHVALGEGRPGDAGPLFERALRIRETCLGADHATVAEALIGLASLDTAQGRHAKAAASLERAIGIVERLFAAGHPELAELRDARAEALRSAERAVAENAR